LPSLAALTFHTWRCLLHLDAASSIVIQAALEHNYQNNRFGVQGLHLKP
jgi:hypothetical protein